MLTRLLRRPRRAFDDERGQAAFEFLLIVPTFLLFFLMLIDFGVTMYGYVSVANGVRDGARLGSANCGDGSCTVSEIQDRVVERAGGFLSGTGDVSVDWPEGKERGDAVAVRVSHDHEFLFFPFTWTIESCAEMRLERTESGSASGSGC